MFAKLGVPEPEAELAADVLAAADLRGIDSHGVARLHTYFDLLSRGPHQSPAHTFASCARARAPRPWTATTASASWSGPGPTRSRWTRRRKRAAGWVAVCNTNHYGIAGYYPLQALERDLIGWAMTNSSAGSGAALGRRADAGHEPDRDRLPRPRGAARS